MVEVLILRDHFSHNLVSSCRQHLDLISLPNNAKIATIPITHLLQRTAIFVSEQQNLNHVIMIISYVTVVTSWMQHFVLNAKTYTNESTSLDAIHVTMRKTVSIVAIVYELSDAKTAHTALVVLD